MSKNVVHSLCNARYRAFRPDTDLNTSFDCGNPDLNGFLLETTDDTPNATKYEQEHLAKTYIVEDILSHEILAYFSLACDKIERAVSNPTIWNRLSRAIPNAKRRSSYPAIKIGRLAVAKQAQGLGLGFEIITFLKGLFFRDAKAGCRYLTVDAYLDATFFYTKCQFKPLVDPAPDDETVLMYYDLLPIYNQVNR